eukprot:5636853-Pyramimonas_sp.AAC.1
MGTWPCPSSSSSPGRRASPGGARRTTARASLSYPCASTGAATERIPTRPPGGSGTGAPAFCRAHPHPGCEGTWHACRGSARRRSLRRT